MPVSDPGRRPEIPGTTLLGRLIGRLAVLLVRLRYAVGTRVGHTLAGFRRGEHAFVILVAIVIGVLGGFGAILFRKLIQLFDQAFFFGVDPLARLVELPWWQRLLTPAVGGLVVGLIIVWLTPAVKGSGIPEVMDAVVRRGGLIQFRIIIAKAVAAALTLGSGGSAGREGPIVHISSAIGSAVGQIFQVTPRRLRTFVACGAAAGVAATFNAPIAGALFAVEIVLADFAMASLTPIVISSVVATVISRHYLGEHPALRVPHFLLADPWELVIYAVLGLLAGLLSVAFIRLLFGVGSLFDRSRIPPWLRPAVGGIGVGFIALILPHVGGAGYVSMDGALWGNTPVLILGLLITFKLLATCLTIGSGGSGGVFAPSLFLGAMLGALVGYGAQALFPEWTASPGAYALVGMGAVVAGTTHAPITAIMMMFEMTNEYRIIPPLMIACVLAILLSAWLHRNSIYTEKLARRGVKLHESRDVNLLRSLLIEEVMDRDAPTVPASLPFTELMTRLIESDSNELLVVDDKNHYLGAVSLKDVKAILPESADIAPFAIAADAVNEEVPFVVPTDNLDLAMHVFGRTHRDQLAVCADSKTKTVVGVISRDDVIDAYNRRVFQMDLSGGFSSLVAAVRDGRTVEVLGGMHLGEVDLPSSLHGKTLAEANMRQQFDVEVILIQTSSQGADCIEGRPGKLPRADVALEAGDRLLVMGTTESIEKLRNWEPESLSILPSTPPPKRPPE